MTYAERQKRLEAAFAAVSIAKHNKNIAALAYYEALESEDSARVIAKLSLLDDAREAYASALAAYRALTSKAVAV